MHVCMHVCMHAINASMLLPIVHYATDPLFYSYQPIERFLSKLVAIINFSSNYSDYYSNFSETVYRCLYYII